MSKSSSYAISALKKTMRDEPNRDARVDHSGLTLFRKEVVSARLPRVHGDIILSHPVSTRSIMVLLIVIFLGVASWITLGRYVRTETAKGILVTDYPSAKVIALRAGLITNMAVSEGDLVRAGQTLAIVRIEQVREGAEVHWKKAWLRSKSSAVYPSAK